jgi:hypothetical protein
LLIAIVYADCAVQQCDANLAKLLGDSNSATSSQKVTQYLIIQNTELARQISATLYMIQTTNDQSTFL